MSIGKVPKSLSNIQAVEKLNLPDPPPETVTDLASQYMSLNYKESFTELAHPTAIDKMLLPATPQLDSTALDNIEMQAKKIAEDEMKKAIDLQILTKQKI